MTEQEMRAIVNNKPVCTGVMPYNWCIDTEDGFYVESRVRNVDDLNQILILKDKLELKWNQPKNKKPDKDLEVLGFYRNGCVLVVSYMGDNQWENIVYSECISEPLLWMNIPTPNIEGA